MTLEFVLKRAYGRKSQKNLKMCKTEQLSALLSPNRLSNFDQIIQVKGFNLNIPKLFKKALLTVGIENYEKKRHVWSGLLMIFCKFSSKIMSEIEFSFFKHFWKLK